jgi:hypothetical protein
LAVREGVGAGIFDGNGQSGAEDQESLWRWRKLGSSAGSDRCPRCAGWGYPAAYDDYDCGWYQEYFSDDGGSDWGGGGDTGGDWWSGGGSSNESYSGGVGDSTGAVSESDGGSDATDTSSANGADTECADGCVATREIAGVPAERFQAVPAGVVPAGSGNPSTAKGRPPKMGVGARARMGRRTVSDAHSSVAWQGVRAAAETESSLVNDSATHGTENGSASNSESEEGGGGDDDDYSGSGIGIGSGDSGYRDTGSGSDDSSGGDGSGSGSDGGSSVGTDGSSDGEYKYNWWTVSPEQCAMWELDGTCDAALGCVDTVDCACSPECEACRARGLTYDPVSAETCAGSPWLTGCYIRSLYSCAVEAASSRNGTCYDPYSPYFYSGCPPPPDFLLRFCGPADADFYYPTESPCRVVSADLKTTWLGAASPVLQACKVQGFGSAFKTLNWNDPGEADGKCQQLGEAVRALGYPVRSWAYLRYDTAISTVRNSETGRAETVVHPGNQSYCEMESVCNHNASLSPSQCVADKVHPLGRTHARTHAVRRIKPLCLLAQICWF